MSLAPISLMTEPKPVDLVHLAQYTGGDVRLNAELLEMFVQQCGTVVERLQSLLDTPDTRLWAESAHSLKGAAAGIGAFDVAESAGCAEAIDPATKGESAADCVALLRKRCDLVKSFVDSYLKR